MHKLLSPIFIVLFGGAGFAVPAQTPAAGQTPVLSTTENAIKPNLALGEVLSINQTGGKISLLTKDGTLDVVLTAATVFKRVPPENPKFSAAVDSSLSDIETGDKVVAAGALASDRKSLSAKTIYLMTKSDISKRNETERTTWKTRGISGRIVSLNPDTQEFTIAARGTTGEQNVVVSPKDTADYRRYATDSVRFADAKTSSFNELKIGDQVRALGDKTAGGAGFKAERIVSGSFKMVGGTITAIDTAKNEITIKELQTAKPLTIVVNINSMLRKFPAEAAASMAMRMQPPGKQQTTQEGGGQNGGGAANTMMHPPQGNQSNGQSQTLSNGTPQGAGSGNGRGELEDLLEGFPVISIADLKIGDAIAVSSTSGAGGSRFTAIKLVSGVEPFFKAVQMPGGGGGMQRSSQGAGLSIPGLEGGMSAP